MHTLYHVCGGTVPSVSRSSVRLAGLRPEPCLCLEFKQNDRRALGPLLITRAPSGFAELWAERAQKRSRLGQSSAVCVLADDQEPGLRAPVWMPRPMAGIEEPSRL